MTYRGVARGNTIELEESLPYMDGQTLEVQVAPLPTRMPDGSIEAILRAMAEPPHLTDEDVDDLERAIEANRIPVRHEGIFDEA